VSEVPKIVVRDISGGDAQVEQEFLNVFAKDFPEYSLLTVIPLAQCRRAYFVRRPPGRPSEPPPNDPDGGRTAD